MDDEVISRKQVKEQQERKSNSGKEILIESEILI